MVIIPDWWSLSPNPGITGAMKGFRDMICAVRFVRGKAAEYGGDPTRVTLMGFSAGACGKTIALGGEAPFRALAENDEPGAYGARGVSPSRGVHQYSWGLWCC